MQEARKWYRLAADQGHPRAQFFLGALFEDGHDIAPNIESALSWYRKSAEQGLADAQYTLGALYEQGAGGPERRDEGLEWLALAVEQDHVLAAKYVAHVLGLAL
jgi:TPR repeat protein